MSYSMFAVIFLVTIALSLAKAPVFDRERNVLARFYSDSAQLYRPANLKSYVSKDRTIEQYQFYFPEREYARITEESLTMLHTNVIDRTITFYSMPNFAVNGSRYFYRRYPKQESPVEIELINPDDRLFREVNRPDRYFYLPSYDSLEYSNQVPVLPYYEVTFICNTSSSQKQAPLLSYMDRSLQYSPRYLLDLPSVLDNQPIEMQAYADIRNTGEEAIVIKGAELIAGDITLNRQPMLYSFSMFGAQRGQDYVSSTVRPLGEQASGTIVYQLSLPSPVTVPARSLKTVRFLDSRVVVDSFFYYSSFFTPVNSNGKLLIAYNLTSIDNFLPSGSLLLNQQGRFLGQIDIPGVPANSTFGMRFGADADLSYRRQVTILSEEENDRTVNYRVEYVFENVKPSRDVLVYFSESFNSLKSFRIEELSRPTNDNNLLNIELRGTDLDGHFLLPRQTRPIIISYKILIVKDKPQAYLS